MKAKDLMRKMKSAGWVEVASRGSHFKFCDPSRPWLGAVIVPVHAGKELKPDTLRSILRQTGLEL